MVIGWDNFCKKCGTHIARNRELCLDCANPEAPPRKGTKGKWRKAPLIILVALFLGAFLSASPVHAVTYEQAQWWIQANLPGVCSECPEVVQFYMDKLNEVPTYAPAPPTSANPEPQVIPINETHELVIKDGYNITRRIAPQEPVIGPQPVIQPDTLTMLLDRISALEARISALEARIKELEAD